MDEIVRAFAFHRSSRIVGLIGLTRTTAIRLAKEIGRVDHAKDME
ncbi:hypothetical protein FBZ88_114111 [Nitrospirillum bahiense]|uniref:Uncharacterized protein n=1 Tax=Nitrospirillum amazonense TaxID=28077 RepID=A0A560FNJ6_9PROT|nr:hypothetical protein FBZ88_114111 [Nitrospirillum amazonense]